MPRGQSRRAWIKIYLDGMLNGSVRYQLDAAERGTWIDLILFAALGPTPGTISDNDSRPYPHSFLANRFNIPLTLFEETLTKCQAEGRLTEDEQGIHITNWVSYQSEYERQKRYRIPPTPPVEESRVEESRVEESRVEESRVEESRGKNVTTAVTLGTPPISSPRQQQLSAQQLIDSFSLDEYDALTIRFPDIDLAWEAQKCLEWWATSKKVMKRPKLAFRNWLEKAKPRTPAFVPPRPLTEADMEFETETKTPVGPNLRA